jgi:uncharacterized protein YbcI
MDSPQRDSVASEVSNMLVSLLKRHTGRGPVKARTTLGPDTILCILQDALTQAEKTLVESGRENLVLTARKDFQMIMREEASSHVERLTGRRVLNFMSDSTVDPDMSAEVFVLEPRPAEARPEPEPV